MTVDGPGKGIVGGDGDDGYGSVADAFRRTLVPELDAAMSAACESMGDAAFRAAFDAGRALSYQDAGELACDLIGRAQASSG